MRTARIKIAELSALHKAVVVAGAHPQIGHQALEQTEGYIKAQLNKELYAEYDVIMSALWSAKMLEELGLLKKATGVTFKNLLAATLPNVDQYYFWEKKNK